MLLVEENTTWLDMW